MSTPQCPSHSSEADDDTNALHGIDRRCTDRLEFDEMIPTGLQRDPIPDVYELAAAIGSTMEPILDEFGHDKLEPLTKEVVQCLELFEKTVNLLTKETEKSLEYQYNLEKSQHDLNTLRSKHEKEVERCDETIIQLQATIDALQHSNDTLVENWDLEAEESRRNAVEEFEKQPSQAELSLAKQLRETLERVHRLEKESDEYKDDIQILSDRLEKYKRIEEAQYLSSSNGASEIARQRSSTSNTLDSDAKPGTPGSDTESKTLSKNTSIATFEDAQDESISIVELQKVLRDKNFFKEKCFMFEEQLMEYKMMLANYQLQQAGAIRTLSPSRQGSTSSQQPRTSRSSFFDMISPSKPGLTRLFSMANRSNEPQTRPETPRKSNPQQ